MQHTPSLSLVAVLELVHEEVWVPRPEPGADVLPPPQEVDDQPEEVVEVARVAGMEEALIELVDEAVTALKGGRGCQDLWSYGYSQAKDGLQQRR